MREYLFHLRAVPHEDLRGSPLIASEPCNPAMSERMSEWSSCNTRDSVIKCYFHFPAVLCAGSHLLISLVRRISTRLTRETSSEHQRQCLITIFVATSVKHILEAPRVVIPSSNLHWWWILPLRYYHPLPSCLPGLCLRKPIIGYEE